jgi:hypothetical protein
MLFEHMIPLLKHVRAADTVFIRIIDHKVRDSLYGIMYVDQLHQIFNE